MTWDRTSVLPRVFVVWGEPRWVCRLGHLAVGDLLERVVAPAIRIEGVHEMHFSGVAQGTGSLGMAFVCAIVAAACGRGMSSKMHV